MASLPHEESIHAKLVQWISDVLFITFHGSLATDMVECNFGKHQTARNCISRFLKDTATQTLFFHINQSNDLIVRHFPPTNLRRTLCLYMVRTNPLCPILCTKDVTYGTYVSSTYDIVEHMECIIEDCFLPLIYQLQNSFLPLEVTQQALNSVDGFVSKLQLTKKLIPTPPYTILSDVDSQSKALLRIDGSYVTDAIIDVEEHTWRVSQMEKFLLRWTDIIETALGFDYNSVSAACAKSRAHPDPYDEYKSWAHKATALDGIFQELQGENVRRVLRYLDRSQTKRAYPFAKLCKQLFWSLTEAKSNVHFLRPLAKPFKDLRNRTLTNLALEFLPQTIFHLIFLVWKTSVYYNTKACLIGLVRKLSVVVMYKTEEFLSCGFPTISCDKVCAHNMLLKTRESIGILGKFKTAFLRYKRKSYDDCPSNPWDISNHILFGNIDMVIDRCHALRELYLSFLQFESIRGLVFTGKRGEVLTSSVRQILHDFTGAYKKVQDECVCLSLSLDGGYFESNLFTFKLITKRLDHHLGYIISCGLDDCACFSQKMQLLLSMQTVVMRPSVHIASRVAKLMHSVISEIELLSRNFEQKITSSALNTPSSEIAWCQGLYNRARIQISTFQRIELQEHQKCQGDDAGRIMFKAFTAFEGKAISFERKEINRFRRGIKSKQICDNLNIPVLVQLHRSNNPTAISEDFVALTLERKSLQLLWDAKRMQLLGLGLPHLDFDPVPLGTMLYKRHITIDQIVRRYNEIKSKLRPVEKPFVNSTIKCLFVSLSIAMNREHNSEENRLLMWTSQQKDFDLFCKDAKCKLSLLEATLTAVQLNVSSIDRLMDALKHIVFFKDFPKVMCISEATVFLDNYWLSCQEKFRHEVQGICSHLQSLQSTTELKLEQDWTLFSERIEKKYAKIIVQLTVRSLNEFEHLVGGKMLGPAVEVDALKYIGTGYSIRDKFQLVDDIVGAARKWMSCLLNNCAHCPCVDMSDGIYTAEILSSPMVLSLIAMIEQHLRSTEKRCKKCIENIHCQVATIWNMAISQKPPYQCLDDVDEHSFGEGIEESVLLQSKIDSLPSHVNVQFVRIDCQKLKQWLEINIAKSIHRHISIVGKHIWNGLQEIHNLLKTTSILLDSTTNDQFVLRAISVVRENVKIFPALLSHLQRLSQMLSRFDIALSPLGINTLRSAGKKWEKIVTESFKTEEMNVGNKGK